MNIRNFSQACKNNKQPILDILKTVLTGYSDVLEIGSGSGQHAIFFGSHLPNTQWHTTELPENLNALHQNINQYARENVTLPVSLDVSSHPWPHASASNIFSANTLHIMNWENVVHFFRGLGNVLSNNGYLCVYGPFRYNNNYTTESNARFDIWLKDRDPDSGIRDFEAVDQLAAKQDLRLIYDHAMPANNQFLIWQKS